MVDNSNDLIYDEFIGGDVLREVKIPELSDAQINELFKDTINDLTKSLYKKSARTERIINKIKKNPTVLDFALKRDEEVFCPDTFMFLDKNDSLFFKRAVYFQALFDYFASDYSNNVSFKTITTDNKVIIFNLFFISNQGGLLKYNKLKTNKFDIDLTNIKER